MGRYVLPDYSDRVNTWQRMARGERIFGLCWLGALWSVAAGLGFYSSLAGSAFTLTALDFAPVVVLGPSESWPCRVCGVVLVVVSLPRAWMEVES